MFRKKHILDTILGLSATIHGIRRSVMPDPDPASREMNKYKKSFPFSFMLSPEYNPSTLTIDIFTARLYS
jgi:hypothetical protein